MSDPVASGARTRRVSRYGPSRGNPATTDSSPAERGRPRRSGAAVSPSTDSTARSRSGSNTTICRRKLAPDAGDLDRRLAHPRDDVGVRDDLARCHDPAGALLSAAARDGDAGHPHDRLRGLLMPGDAATPRLGRTTG